MDSVVVALVPISVVTDIDQMALVTILDTNKVHTLLVS